MVVVIQVKIPNVAMERLQCAYAQLYQCRRFQISSQQIDRLDTHGTDIEAFHKQVGKLFMVVVRRNWCAPSAQQF